MVSINKKLLGGIEMRGTRKILCAFLAAAFIFSTLLTGCGSNAGSADDATTTSAEAVSSVAAPETTAEAKTLEPYEVKWYMIGTKDYAEKTLVQDELANQMKDINTTLKIQVFPWATYSNQIAMVINSGEQFDICFMGTNTSYYPNVAKGAFVDLTDLIDTDLPKLKSMMYPEFLEGPKVKGRIYGLPTNKEIPEAYGVEVNTDLLKPLKGVSFDGIKSYAELETILKTAKEQLPADVFPMSLRETTMLRDGSFDNLGDYTIPGVVRLGDDKVINQFETPEFMANWQLMRKFVQEGLVNKNGATSGAPDYWATGKALCRVELMGPLPTYTGAQGQIVERHTIGKPVIMTGATTGAMQCFSKTTKDIHRALLFYETLNASPDLYNLLMYGIKDKHYRIIDETTTPKRVDFLEGQTEDTVGYIHAGGAWSLGGNWFASYLGKNDPADRNVNVDTYNKSATTSKLLGFAFDVEPVKTEVAACATVYQEIGVPLNNGAIDPVTGSAKFLEKLKAAGMDKIITEKQKQINQWKADNGK
jgi:putative aldouronate transport system substrate-binding protein